MTPPDPIFPALTRWHRANEAYRAAHRRARRKWPEDLARAEDVANRAAWGSRERALQAVYGTAPTTLAGLAALAEAFHAEEFAILAGDEAARGLLNILRSIARLTATEQRPDDEGAALVRLRRAPVFAVA